MRILLVEDDPVVRDVLARSLGGAGYRTEEAGSLEEGCRLWESRAFDAVLLDLDLPRTAASRRGRASGLTALASARARGDRTPVIVLTARNSTDERVAGLKAGADDYIGKPFDLREVEARLQGVLRRATGTQDEVRVAGLSLDRRKRRFAVHGQALELPMREFEVLWELMTPAGRVASKRELAAKIAAPGGDLGDNALEAFISRLRKKLGGSGVRIRTLRGLGYLLEAEP